MTRILLATDGSSNALRAARKLIALASEWSTPPVIVPITVHRPLPLAGRVSRVLSQRVIQQYQQQESTAALEPVLKILKKAGFEAKPIATVGPAAETIVAQAKRGKFDMICMGTRGMTATGNLLLGSVASRVLHLADMPVLTVR